MDELRALQAELAAAQRGDGRRLKLSEHHVVDLIIKMQKLGKVELIYTLDAKAVLTPKQLNREIHDMLLRQMGRVTLTDLYQGINVDISYIENECKAIAQSSSDVSFIGGELIAEWYLDGIMEDMNEALQATGHVTMGDLALQYGFTVEFMASVVASRLGSIIKAEIKSNTLYTQSFVARQGARIRGIFSAITRPVALPEIVAISGIDEPTIANAIAHFIECKSLNGTLRGREYVPQIFLDTQRRLIFDFFTSNGYLPYSMAHQLHIQRPFDYLKKDFPDAIALRNIAVSHQMLLQVESAVDEAIQEQSWVDGRSIFPATISDSDISELFSKCSALKSTKKPNSAIQIDQVYIASSGFLNSVLEKFHEHAIEKADKAALDIIQLKTQHKDNKNPRKNQKKSHTVYDPLSIVPFKEDMEQLILSWLECCHDEDEFVGGLVNEIFQRVADIYESALDKAIHAIHRGGSTTKHDLEALFESRFDTLHVQLHCLQKGLQKLQNVAKEDADVIQEHVMTSTALILCNLVLSFVKDVFEVPLNNVASLNDTPILVKTLSSAHISLLEKHTSIASEIIQLWSIRDLGEFIIYLSTLANALSMPLQKCDRKKERAVQTALKNDLDQRIHEAKADLPVLILHAMFLNVTNLAIDITTKDEVISTMLNALRSHIPGHVLNLVQESIKKDELTDKDKQKLLALADAKQF
ncbi:hypothetical protein THRCLA_00167 [Thraustotheca clavata]|uniref:E3 UFM1-protein ligase 1-like N-terminal domain-containing protein n=1 Tax=Thraustotheca clavata TaxID=74557 RepID=A0A1W0ACF9_9STRA|nr:hypothetical protein THRCLA_00167 [Thraustotheca clavata]